MAHSDSETQSRYRQGSAPGSRHNRRGGRRPARAARRQRPARATGVLGSRPQVGTEIIFVSGVSSCRNVTVTDLSVTESEPRRNGPVTGPGCLPVVTVIAAGFRVTGTCRASRLSSPPRMSPGPGRATIESLTRNQTLMSVYRRAASGLKNRHWQLQNQSGEVCLRSSSRLAALSVFVMAGRADFPPPQNFGPRSGPLAKKSNVVGCCGVFRIWIEIGNK